MKTIYFFGFLLIVHILSIIGFVEIEMLCLNTSVSWTASKLIPYVVTGTTGLGLGYLSWLNIVKTRLWTRVLSTLLCAFGGFSIAFYLHPIYEGDFNTTGKMVRNSTLKFSNDEAIVMIALPECTFCHERIETLNLIQKRNPKKTIEIQIISSDSSSISLFSKKTHPEIHVKLAHSIPDLVQLASEKFPTFVEIKHGKAIQTWDNHQFGTGALDHLED
jgi:hypothetical protein